MNDSFIEVASKWIENESVCIVPCHDKVPIIKGWNHGNALSTVESVRNFFNKPNGANGIGVLMGDGIICIDVDMHQGMGMKSIEIWQKEHGKFPNTYFETTPNGGKHLYFYVDKIYNTRLHILEDVDIIAKGYQSIIYPTEGYSIGNDLPIEWANESVYKLLNLKNHNIDKHDVNTGAQYKSVPFNKDDSISDGKRHDFLIREKSKLKNKGVQDTVIETYIREVNERLCVPPIPKKELETTVIGAIERMDGMNENMHPPKGIVLLYGWKDTLKLLNEKGLLFNLIDGLFEYEINGVEPDFTEPLLQYFWADKRQYIDKALVNYGISQKGRELGGFNKNRIAKGLPKATYEEMLQIKEQEKSENNEDG